MRLTQIKISGFKSFADPAAIRTPGRLTAVIGPNGCGKSNVIDAVRWVLGESSAKQLRGESMQDVIFNGSSARRPAPRASVELVFDNSSGTLQGAWGRYTEVAIKRQLTRQGESSYYINGQQVRRRDITDLFLGTGVGAKGYAVIEQGMISRIIEARPEELRTYLEEAAGISKYKERRRETAARLTDAREHLARLADLQTELARQTEKLSRQAEAAERYRSLNAELAQHQNLADFAQWQNALAQADQAQTQHQAAQARQQQNQAAAEEAAAQMQALRQSEQQHQQTLAAARQRHAQAREQTARLEEQIRAHQAQRQRSERDRQTAQAQLAKLQQQRAEALAEHETLHAQAQAQNEELARLAQIVAEHEARLPEREAAEAEALHNLHSRQDSAGSLKRELALKQQQQAHTQQTLAANAQRRQQLQQELAALAAPDADTLAQARHAADTLQQQCNAAAERRRQSQAQTGSLKARQQEADAHWQALNARHIAADAEYRALTQMLPQDTANDFWAHTAATEAPSLWQNLNAPEEWRHALAAILAERLNARLLPSNPALPRPLPQGTAAWLLAGQSEPKTEPHPQALIRQTQVPAPFQAALSEWLDGVLCAPDLDHALARQNTLQPNQIWLTPEGHRVSRHSTTLFGADTAANPIRLKARRDTLAAEIAAAAPELAQAQAQAQAAAETLAQAEAQAAQAQQDFHTLVSQTQEAQNHATRLIERSSEAQARRERIAQEQERLAEEAEILNAQAAMLADDCETLAEAAAELIRQTDELSGSLNEKQHAARQARLALLEANRRHGAAELARHKTRQRAESLMQQAQTLAAQAEEWQARIEEATLADETDETAQILAEELETAHAQSEALAEAAEAQAAALAQIQQAGQELFRRTQELAAAQPQIQAAVQDALLQQQQALLNAQRFHEQLLARGADTAQLEQTEVSGSLKTLAQRIARLQDEIAALGAVNLAALAELAEARERDGYYRAQSEDVQAAIALLEEAIAQIDGETKARFTETFDAANAKMQEIFPTLFGGGEARLQLAEGDALSAGVSIMARPAGKKNSSIHQLSGGEKALAAMSLVFALFSLNPAPFCLLDEVDAPLDDANTSRFCNLVKEMSAQTQFLYISHNRLTMEMAEQLVGVTMQEKGVSRVVAVDIKQALEMAEPN